MLIVIKGLEMKKNQQGFSVVEVLVVIVVIGLLGVVGWLVYDRQNKQESPKSGTTQPASQPQSSEQDTSPTFAELPNTFKEFKVEESGIRLGYPSAAGTMKSGTAKAGVTYSASTADTFNQENKWKGSFRLDIYKEANFTYTTSKYGATIKPQGDTWVVTAVNPAENEYKAGDTYRMDEKKINGGVAYEFTDNDENYPTTSWIIKLKNGYAVVSLPRLTTTNLFDDPVTAADRSAYTELAAQVVNSFTVF
jgi:prepilin-type N-terminal cleavage/methylation domain-containing protein